MDITRYIVSLTVLLVATVLPLLSAYWIMLLISSQRRRRLQPGQRAASASSMPASRVSGSTRDYPRTSAAMFRLR